MRTVWNARKRNGDFRGKIHAASMLEGFRKRDRKSGQDHNIISRKYPLAEEGVYRRLLAAAAETAASAAAAQNQDNPDTVETAAEEATSKVIMFTTAEAAASAAAAQNQNQPDNVAATASVVTIASTSTVCCS